MARHLPEVPIDEHGEKVYSAQLRGIPVARTRRALTTSFLISLNDETTFIKVVATAQSVYLRWADTDVDYVTNANFHEVIPAGADRVFAIPNQLDGTPYTRIMVVGLVAGATVDVIEY